MNVEQINERVTREADARVDETIERLLRLLQYQELRNEPIRRCYCHLLNEGRSVTEELGLQHVCENCKDG